MRTAERKAKRVLVRLSLEATELEGPRGRRLKRALERGFEKAIGCLIACLESEFECEKGWKPKYCRVVLTKVGNVGVGAARRLAEGNAVEFDVEDTTEDASNLDAIDQNIDIAVEVVGDNSKLLNSLKTEAFDDGVLTPNVAAMTARDMGTAVTSDTTITTTYFTDAAAVDQQDETAAVDQEGEDEDGGAMAVIIGGAVGGVILIALAAALYVKRSNTSGGSSSSNNTTGAYEEKAIEGPGDRSKTHSIVVNENFENPMIEKPDEM
jgi:hypothetical protein